MVRLIATGNASLRGEEASSSHDRTETRPPLRRLRFCRHFGSRSRRRWCRPRGLACLQDLPFLRRHRRSPAASHLLLRRHGRSEEKNTTARNCSTKPLIEEDHACLDAFTGPPRRWLGRGRGSRPSGTAAVPARGASKERGALI
jgi:hypothetical protein